MKRLCKVCYKNKNSKEISVEFVEIWNKISKKFEEISEKIWGNVDKKIIQSIKFWVWFKEMLKII